MRTLWGQAVGAGIVLGLAALATNLPLHAWGARGETALTALLTASRVVNSGTAWAGLGVLAGWLVSRRSDTATNPWNAPKTNRHSPSPGHAPCAQSRTAPPRVTLNAALAAVIASELALIVHYVVGQAIGHFDASIWWANKSWFVAAIVMGAPMGIVGALAHRIDRLGLAARLVVPAGAVIEPLMRGFFRTPGAPHATHAAAVASGVILVLSGLVGATGVAVTTRQQRRALTSSPVVGATH